MIKKKRNIVIGSGPPIKVDNKPFNPLVSPHLKALVLALY